MRRWVLLALAAAACGDNLALSPVSNLVIVAHEDDDLLFMQSDVSAAIRNNEATTIVYVTAGDGGAGLDYAKSRVVAAQSAYGWIGGSQDWQCQWGQAAAHPAWRCDLSAANLTLLFLGYPDGGVSGERPTSLLALWEGSVQHADTIADRVTRYDRAGLIETLGELIAQARPTTIRTLELSGVHGADHSDHMLVGALTLLAAARAHSQAQIVSYRGYNVNYDPPNVPEALSDRISLGMRAYEACQTGCAVCGGVCDSVADPRYQGFLHRHYAVATRQPPMTGQLRTAGGCLIVDGAAVSIGDCARATELRFGRGGAIRAGDRCLRVGAGHRVFAAPCHGGPESYFVLDEEGQLWSGIAPPPGPAMDYNHTTCLIGDASGVHAEVCGAQLGQQWQLGRASVVTLRSQLGLTAQGRAVQLADVTGDGLADLCRIENGGLWCAVGDGRGGFTDSVRVDWDAHPLAIDPQSLMLGDVDGDGVTDACGRSALGIQCALAADDYVARKWSPAFGGAQMAALGERSLSIVDDKVCGMDGTGVACAVAGEPEATRSTWPGAGVALWPGDLDGDGAVDWCVASPTGPACGLDADRTLTSEGTPWGFAFHDIEGSLASDGAVADQVHGALADISGDGRADLCVAVGNAVECALSQGHAFGPRFPVLTLPAGAVIQALWLGDLDGDGKADACVDDGTAISCAISP